GRSTRWICMLTLVAVISGCAQVHQLWNTPIADLLPFEQSGQSNVDDCIGEDLRTSALDRSVEPGGGLVGSGEPPVEAVGARSLLAPPAAPADETPTEQRADPIYALTEPVAVYEPEARSNGHLRRMMRRARRQWRRANRPSLSDRMHDVWHTPLIDLPVPFAGAITDWWNEPVLWAANPPEDFVDPIPYRHCASQIDYPDVESPPLPPETFAVEPRRLRNPQKEEIWDMPLEQARQIALANSHIIRSGGQFLNPDNPLLMSPEFVAPSLDPAIQESGVLYGQRGVEA